MQDSQIQSKLLTFKTSTAKIGAGIPRCHVKDATAVLFPQIPISSVSVVAKALAREDEETPGERMRLFAKLNPNH